MEITTLYDLFISFGSITTEEKDVKTFYSESYKEHEKLLIATFSDEQKEIFDKFKFCFTQHMFNIRDKDCNQVIFDCVEIGIEFQKHLFNKYS